MAGALFRTPSTMLSHGGVQLDAVINALQAGVGQGIQGVPITLRSNGGTVLGDSSGNARTLTETAGTAGTHTRESCALARFGDGVTFRAQTNNNGGNTFARLDGAFASTGDKAMTAIFRVGAKTGGDGAAPGGTIVCDGSSGNAGLLLNLKRSLGGPFSIRLQSHSGTVFNTSYQPSVDETLRLWVRRIGAEATVSVNGTRYVFNIGTPDKGGDGICFGAPSGAGGADTLQDGAIYSSHVWVGASTPSMDVLDNVVASAGTLDGLVGGEAGFYTFEPAITAPRALALETVTASDGTWSIDLTPYALDVLYDFRASAVTLNGLALIGSADPSTISGAVKDFAGANLGAGIPVRVMVVGE